MRFKREPMTVEMNQDERRKNFWKGVRLNVIALLFLIIGIGCYVLFGEQTNTKSDADTPVIGNIAKIERQSLIHMSEDIAKQVENKNISDTSSKIIPDITPEVTPPIVTAPETISDVVPPVTQTLVPLPSIPITTRSPDDFYPNDRETVATINIPSIGIYQPVTYGDSQENIDNYEVVIRTGHRVNQNCATILAGHNYKSFGKLANLAVGSKIYTHTYYGDYTFTVTNVQKGMTDGWNIYDNQGQALMDFYTYENTLYLYTCDGDIENSRILVSAHMDT